MIHVEKSAIEKQQAALEAESTATAMVVDAVQSLKRAASPRVRCTSRAPLLDATEAMLFEIRAMDEVAQEKQRVGDELIDEVSESE